MTSNKFDNNLKQIFSLIPLVYANPSITLNKLKDLAGYKNQKELLRDLDRLLLIGASPFSPTDFISVSIEDDKVFVDFPQGLERPFDLNANEWLVLKKIIEIGLTFQKSGADESDLLADILQKVSSVPVQVSDANQNNSTRRLLNEALTDKIQIQFTYKSLSSREPEIRQIDPWVVFEHNGMAYVIGYCHTRKAVRNFSLLRMLDVVLFDLEIEEACPKNINSIIHDTAIFQTSNSGFSLKLALDPTLRKIAELVFSINNWEENNTQNNIPNKWVIGTCKVSSQIWLFEILRSLGPKVILIEPSHLRQKFLEELNDWPMCNLLEQKDIR